MIRENQNIYVRIFYILILIFGLWSNVAQAQLVTRTTNSTGGPIPNSTNCSNILARDFSNTGPVGTIKDVNFTIVISHPRRSDLIVELDAPGAGPNVTLVNRVGGNAGNLNVILDNQANPPVSITSHNNNDIVGPSPFGSFIPAPGSLNSFNNLLAGGTWTLRVCDQRNGMSGSFVRADLDITRFNADLSLTKTVDNNRPRNGEIVNYTLSVSNNAASEIAANNVTVRDVLPAEFQLVGTSGFGTFTGSIWTVGNVPVGVTRTITLSVRANGAAGSVINDEAEISQSSEQDADSTPNNGAVGEDDYASVSLTILNTPGTPPDLATNICRPAGVGTSLLEWDGFGWPSGSLTHMGNVTGLGTVSFAVSTNSSFVSPLQVNGTNTGGLQREGSLHQNILVPAGGQSTTTVITLPTPVPGAQFSLFDVDGNPLNVRDRVTIRGSYLGNMVIPILTQGVTHTISGNQATGFTLSNASSSDGNLVVTFTQPIDGITIVYEGLNTLSAGAPLPESVSIYDILFCQPAAQVGIAKTSRVISDPVNGTANPKAIPGAIVQYCLSFNNAGISSADNIVATDVLPGTVTLIAGTIRSGPDCDNATTIEDDDPFDPPASEPDGIAASGAGQNILVQIFTLAPGGAAAVTFDALLQ